MADKPIWAPWRAQFVLADKEEGCVFCNRLQMPDTVENLIVHRGRLNFVILNKFPYNAGHTMIVPQRHLAEVEDLSSDEACEFFELTRRTVAVIRQAIEPHSLNLGMNLGVSSGAGIPDHLHMHVVPRWTGDTNFMPVIGQTRVISVPLEPIYEAMKKGFTRS